MKLVFRLLTLVMALCGLSSYAQTYPNFFPLGEYNVDKGINSYLRWINSDADTPNNINDAVIFGTSTSRSDQMPKDMLRLTIAGVATFNSPFAGYTQTVELRNQGILVGRFRTAGSMLDIEGSGAVNVGTIANPFIFQVADKSCSLKTPLQFSDNTNNNLWLGLNTTLGGAWIGSRSSTNLNLGVNSQTAMTVEAGSHNIYVGLSSGEIANVAQSAKSKYGFFVKKGILSEDYAIGPVASWSDFVFNKDYKLRPLGEVEQFIDNNSHLPGVPSAKTVATEGYSQHEMNKILLQKIEELTLYIINQDKEIQNLKAELGK